MDERDADGVTEFCRRHGISKGYLYSLWRRGYGPRFMQAGDRRLISREAGADWRRELARLIHEHSRDSLADVV
jgi:transposase-like protein